jgi:hypothetical protein
MKGLFPMILLLVICIFLLITAEQNIGEGFATQCGTGRGNCPFPDAERCMNGYCNSTTQPKLPYLTGLPVWP